MNDVTNVSLFGEDDDLSARRAEAEQKYKANGVDFHELIMSIHERILSEASVKSQQSPFSIMGRGYYPSNMNWAVTATLQELYPQRMGIDEQKRPFFRLSDNVRLYFKKLDHKGRPQNIPTDHAKALNSCQGNLFGEPNMILYIGWQIRKNKYWDSLSGVYLLEMQDMKHLKWISDASGLSRGTTGNGSIQPLMPVSPIIDNDEISVVPRTSADDATQTGS